MYVAVFSGSAIVQTLRCDRQSERASAALANDCRVGKASARRIG